MIRTVFTVLPLLCLLPPAHAQDPPKKPLQVAYHGQSFFTLTTGAGTVVAFDPHAIPQYGRIMGVRADLVLITHQHNEHNNLLFIENATEKDCRILHGLRGLDIRAAWNPIEEKVKDVQVKSVGLYHDNMEGLKIGKNTAFVLEVDGWRIVHLGDLGHELTNQQLRRIGPVDVVMIPVGGIYTINGSEARRVIEQLKPKEYIFPMHYGTKEFEDLLPIDEFLEDTPAPRVVRSDDNKITLNRDADRPRPLVVQLHYWAKGSKAGD